MATTAKREPIVSDNVLEARINELCHQMTVCDTIATRVWLCAQLKGQIKALNDARLARLNDALSSLGA